MSHDTIGRLPLKTIVPITDWKPSYAHYPWMVEIKPDRSNGLFKVSAIDCFQIKNFTDKRFVKKIGQIDNATLMIVHTLILKTLDPYYIIE